MRFESESCFGNCNGSLKVVPLGNLDREALAFFKNGVLSSRGMWVLGENLCQAFGFVPKWICPVSKTVGVAVREDCSNKGNIFGLCQFIYSKHRYKVEYQISPVEEVQKAIDFYFPEEIPKQA
jgi:hypothetical protein